MKSYAYAALGAIITTILVLAFLEVLHRKTGVVPSDYIANFLSPRPGMGASPGMMGNAAVNAEAGA